MILFDRAATAPGFAFLLLLDANGIFVSGSDDMMPKGSDRSGTDYVRHFPAHPDDHGLHVSPPAISRVGGHWMVMLSRRILGADGALEGIVVGGIEVRNTIGLRHGGRGARIAAARLMSDRRMPAPGPRSACVRPDPRCARTPG